MHALAQYLPDNTIDDALDCELRGLLTTCFTKPEDVVFKDRRYFVQPYPHRWVIRDGHGRIVAHIGVHEKTVEAQERTFRIGGIAEVCVHPDYRGKGYVRMMLLSIHEWLLRHGFDFAVLFGDPSVYGSSGYVEVKNLFYDAADGSRKQVTGMVKPLSATPWPAGDVHLPGPKF